MKKSLLFMICAGTLIFTGCETCKSNEESGECFPLCKNDKEDNLLLTEKNWNTFKKFRPIPYSPMGIPLIDNNARIITKLSNQITEEVVNPYFELDKEKLIVTYYHFIADVKSAAEKQDCTFEKAAELTWKDWLKRPGGEQTCAKLKRAVPFIVNMRAGNQLTKALLRVSGDVRCLMITLPRQLEESKRTVKTTERQFRFGVASVQVLYNLGRLSVACSYLAALKADVREQDRQIEEYVIKVAEL